MSDKSELMVRAEQVLLDMVNKAAELGSAAVDEIPLVVQELLLYNFVVELVIFLISILIVSSLIFLNVKYLMKVTEEDTDTGAFMIASSVGIGFLFTLVALSHTDWLKIWLAPRVYLLEYAAQLIK